MAAAATLHGELVVYTCIVFKMVIPIDLCQLGKGLHRGAQSSCASIIFGVFIIVEPVDEFQAAEGVLEPIIHGTLDQVLAVLLCPESLFLFLKGIYVWIHLGGSRVYTFNKS